MSTYQEIADKLEKIQTEQQNRITKEGTLPYQMYQAWQKSGGEQIKALRGQESEALTKYVGEAPRLREEYSDVWNPYARERLVGQGMEQAYRPITDVRSQLSERASALAAATSGVVTGYGKETERLGVQGQQLESAYGRAWNVALAEEDKRRWEENMKLQREEIQKAAEQWQKKWDFEQEQWDWEKAQPTGKSGGGGGSKGSSSKSTGSKYTMKKNSVGGLSFYDENMGAITANQYLAGKSGGDVDIDDIRNLLSQSEDEGDQQIVADIDSNMSIEELKNKYPWVFGEV